MAQTSQEQDMKGGMAFQRVSGVAAKSLEGQRFRGRQIGAPSTDAHGQFATVRVHEETLIQLLEWENLAPWRQRGSEYLRTGYRPECASLWSCLHSWSYLHNETVNIFSHIFGAIVFFALPSYIFRTEIPSRYKLATTADIIVCSIYFLGVGVCFTLSTIFHTFMCHSEAVYSLGVKLDYQGIVLLTWGANVPLIYYSIPCDLRDQVVYWTFNTVLAGLCSLATLHPFIGGHDLGHVRVGLFALFGFCSVVAPVLIRIPEYGFEEQNRRVGLAWIASTALLDGVGSLCYSLKFPERWYPRVFDLFGASHQIMHITVIFAALSYARAVLQAFDFRHENPRACNQY
ncbi:hemolysin-III channel protein-like protein Izh2 [Hypoxylon sp. NC1633]|nr:hemolysin-III channel protein-like protein Izh2 [Hypoxylon sp. NC1633]